MPFGLNIAPFVFTKIMKPPIALLRTLGIRLIIYLDDIQISAASSQCLSQDTTLTVSLLTRLSFIINNTKSVLIPRQIMEFLGLIINSETMTLSLPITSLENIISRIRSLARKQTCTARQLAALIGSMVFANKAIQSAPIYFRSLQFDLIQCLRYSKDYNQIAVLCKQSTQDLQWWISSEKIRLRRPNINEK